MRRRRVSRPLRPRLRRVHLPLSRGGFGGAAPRIKDKKHLLAKRLISKIFSYPTESFFALGADATNPKAIAKIFRLKGRKKRKPIALIAGNWRQVEEFFYLNRAERRLAKRYWPGALTLLLRPKKKIAADALFWSPSPARWRDTPPQARGRSVRIGVRIPAHTGARSLALAVGVPMTATSANISGQPPTKSAARVKRNFPDILVMPGQCGQMHRPSTMVEIVNRRIKVIRRGSVII